MTFVNHMRLSLLGDLPNGEQFSCNLSLEPQGDQWQTQILPGRVDLVLSTWADEIAPLLFEDLVADCVAYWGRAETNIAPNAVLKRVKLAPIGAEGNYVGNPQEAAVNQAGGRNGPIFPLQISRKTTLLTDGDLGRVKGGWFQPMPSAYLFDFGTNLWPVDVVNDVEASTLQFIEDINNRPGLDSDGFRVVVASQGRHNPDGTVRRPPTNHDVTGVSIGRRADVQRRRANKIGEARTTPVFL